jgi:hypothetical protein
MLPLLKREEDDANTLLFSGLLLERPAAFVAVAENE